MSKSITYTIITRRRWWLSPWLRLVGIASGMTGWQPSVAAISAWARRGVRVEVTP